MIDANNNYVLLLEDQDTGEAIPAKVDPTTGRLLIQIKPATITSEHRTPKIDENHEPAGLVSDGTETRPLLCDTDANLIIAVTCE
jgi:hypothetical protein